MEKIILDYITTNIQTLLSWPVIAGLLIATFINNFENEISDLIRRIKRIGNRNTYIDTTQDTPTELSKESKKTQEVIEDNAKDNTKDQTTRELINRLNKYEFYYLNKVFFAESTKSVLLRWKKINRWISKQEFKDFFIEYEEKEQEAIWQALFNHYMMEQARGEKYGLTERAMLFIDYMTGPLARADIL
jgi:hypothetical protein